MLDFNVGSAARSKLMNPPILLPTNIFLGSPYKLFNLISKNSFKETADVIKVNFNLKSSNNSIVVLLT